MTNLFDPDNREFIDWHCAACAGLGSSELDPVVPDSPPPSSPQPASPTPASPAAPSTPSSPLPASPIQTTAPPIAVELSLEDPDPAKLEIQQPHQLTFTVVDDATLKRKRKLVDNDGYTYTDVKRQCVNATHWQCTVRPKVNIAFPCDPEIGEKAIYASVECPSNSFLFFCFISLISVEQQ